MVLAVIILILVLICLIPMGARAVYSVDGPEVKVVVGPLSFLVYPRPEKEKTPKQLEKEELKAREKAEKKAQKAAEKQKKKEEKKAQKEAEKAFGVKKPKEPIGGKIEFFKQLLGLGLNALGCIKRKLILKDLKLYLTVGAKGDDAAKGAITYGRAWAAVGALIPVLENTFRIKKRDIQVNLDYFSEKNVIYAQGTIIFLVGDILWIAIYYGVRALKLLLKQKRKGRKQHGTSHQ